jgi:hypothetical protein
LLTEVPLSALAIGVDEDGGSPDAKFVAPVHAANATSTVSASTVVPTCMIMVSRSLQETIREAIANAD